MTQSEEQKPEPRGFSEHSRKASSENAHEQGWGLNQDQRTQLPQGKQPYQGGNDYDYGARDFGDSPQDTSSTRPSSPALESAEAFRGPGGTEIGTERKKKSA